MNQPGARLLLLLSLALLIIPVVSACQESTTPSTGPVATASPPGASPVITISFAVPKRVYPFYAELVERFEGEHPDIAVQLVDQDALLENASPQDQVGEIWLLVAQGADVALWRWPALSQGNPVLLDLAPFIAADVALDSADFYPGLLRTDSQARTFVVPLGASIDTLFYNKALFDDAGRPYPQPGWTLDEFQETVAALTQVDAAGVKPPQYGFLDPAGGPEYVRVSAGGLIDMGTTPPSARLDSPALAQAVQRYAQLVAGGVTPNWSNLDQDQRWAETDVLTSNGQVAVWMDAIERLGYRQARQSLGIVTFPRAEATAGIPLYPTAGLAISAGTAHPDAAWRWLSWLSHQDVHSVLNGAVPSRRSLAGESFPWSTLPESLAASYRWALEHPAPGTGVLEISPLLSIPVVSALQSAIDQVIAGQSNVETALSDAQTRAAAVLEGYGAGIPEPTPFVVSAPTPVAVDPGVTLITFAAMYAEDLPALRSTAAAFQQAEKTIQVQVQLYDGSFPLPDPGAVPSLARVMAAQAECFPMWGVLRDEDFAALLSLTPFVEADSAFDLGDFYPVTLAKFRHDGALWGLPAGGVVHVVLYRRGIFDRAGLPYPQPGWNVDDFLATAQALRRAQPSADFPYISFNEEFDAGYFMRELGAAPYVPGSDPPRPQFDSAAVLGAVNWYLDLARVYQVKPQYFLAGPGSPSDDDTNNALVNDGRVGMWTTILGGGNPYKGAVDLGYAPLPRNPGVSGAWPDYLDLTPGYLISARADAAQAQACWRWISFLTTQPDLVQGLAPRRSVFASAAYRARLPADLYSVYAYVLEREGEQEGYAEPALPLGPADYWFWQAVDEGAAGKDLTLALGAAQRKAEAYIACVGTDQAGTLAERVDRCAREVDPTYGGR